MSRGRRYGMGRLWRRGETWVLDWRDEHGRRHRHHLGPNKRDAEQLRIQLVGRRDRILGGLEAAPQDVALDELRARYLADLEARAVPMHVVNVRQALDLVFGSIAATTVHDLRPADVMAFRSERLRQGWSHRNANFIVQALRGMIRWGVDAGLVDRDPLKGLKKLPETARTQRYKRRALSEEEIGRFIAAAEEEDVALASTVRRISQGPMWRTMIATGLRYGEMRELRWADLDATRASLHVRAETAKSGKARTIPVQRDLVERLLALRAEHHRALGREPRRSDNLFLSARGSKWWRASNNVNRILRRLLKRAGIERVDEQGCRVDLHSLRHTSASRMARAGVPLVHAQRLLGHSDPRLTSKIYTHVDGEDLRASVEMLPAVGA